MNAYLASIPQWIVVYVAPGANGKTDKIPWHPVDAYPVSHKDPSRWMTYEAARAAAAARGAGWGVGFSLSEADDVFCCDIDGARQPDGTWSQLARDLVAALPGCMVELSQSGRGLHVWGRYASPPPHRKKRVDLGIELYSAGQFILLGTQQTGEIAPRCEALPALIETYFRPHETVAADVPDEGPRAGYTSKLTDDEIIDKALNPRGGIAEALGHDHGGVTFRDLWECNVDALARKWPSSKDDDFDRSSADESLAFRLAWWTGSDVARIERLMRRSALVRDKWDDRADYLVERTIKKACRATTNFYGQRDAAQADAAPPPPPTMTLLDAMKSLHGLTTTEASAAWLSTALQLSRAEADEFLHAVERHTQQGRQALKATLRDARRAQDAERSAAAVAARAQGRMQVEHLPESCTAQAAAVEAAIVASATPGEYVSFAGVLSEVTTKQLPFTHMVDHADQPPPAVPLIEPLGKVQVLAQVERVVQFYENRRDGGRKPMAVPPSIIEVLLGKRRHGCPAINGLVTHPLVLRNGEILQGEGLHDESGLYLQGAKVEGARAFTQAEAAQARHWLREVFLEGFEFVDDALHADAALACLLTGVQRRVLDQSPGMAVLASTQSSGKTTLARRLHLVLTGRDMPATTFEHGNEAEVSKALLAMLMRSPAMVCFDNVPDGYTFKSGALAAAMTSPLLGQRLLGFTEEKTVPTNVLFAITGNNLSMGNDEITRWVVVRLTSKKARPESRVFRHPDVVAHALAIRSEVLRLVVGVVAGYVSSGCTMPSATRFPVWDRMVRQALMWAGGRDINEVFKGNAEQSEPVRAHRAIVVNLLEKFGAGEFAASDVVNAAATLPGLRDGLEALGARTAFSSRSAGRILAAKAGATVEVDGREYRIEMRYDRTSVGRYAVVTG